MPKPICVGFEKLAFESTLREHPTDETAALAFTDWLCDHGYQLLGAKRMVSKIRREELDRRELSHIERLFENDMQRRSEIALWIMHEVGYGMTGNPMFIFVPGFTTPRLEVWDGGFRTLYGQWIPEATDAEIAELNLLPCENQDTFVTGARWVNSRLDDQFAYPRT